MRIGLVQLNGSNDPIGNLVTTQSFINDAANDGAEFVMTPEVTNIVTMDRKHQQDVLHFEDADPTLKALSLQAADLKIWLLVGSLAIKTTDPDGRFANRSFLISPNGQISAKYDKIHMFDVSVSEAETYRESAGYRPGDHAVVADIGPFNLGMTICYDIRFPHLFRDLAKAGASLISVPSAMSPITGPAHIETLLRARAIETGCYLAMPSQTGDHGDRSTWGHSMVVDPWGKVILDMGTKPGIACLDLDPWMVEKTREQLPSLIHDPKYTKP